MLNRYFAIFLLLLAVGASAGESFIFFPIDGWHGTLSIPGGCESPCYTYDGVCERTSLAGPCWGPGWPDNTCPWHMEPFADVACTGPEIPYSYSGNWVDNYAFQAPIPDEAVVTHINAMVKGMLFQKRPQQRDLNVFKYYINGELISAIKAPNSYYGDSEPGAICYPNTYPMANVQCKPWCIEGARYAQQFPGFSYSPEATNTFRLEWEMSRKDISTMGYCIDHVDLILFYRYIPAVKMIQAVAGSDSNPTGTQLLYDYQTVDGQDNILYKSKLDVNRTLVGTPEVSLPVVVPYSPDAGNPRKFKLKVLMYGANSAPDASNIKTYWTWTIGAGKNKTTGSGVNTPDDSAPNGRSFEIEISAPSTVGVLPLNLVFSFKQLDPQYPGSETPLATQTVYSNLYSIFGFSKQLDEGVPGPIPTVPTLPSQLLISQALTYNSSAQNSSDCIKNIIQGIFNDKKHIYNFSVGRYVANQFDACDLAEFKYGEYLNDKSLFDHISFSCAATSYLTASLVRSLGVPMGIYGFKQGLLNYNTTTIHTFGNYEGRKELWNSYPFDWHQFNIGGNINDAVMEYREGQTEKYVTDLILDDYKSKIFTDLVFHDAYCSLTNTGLAKISY